MALFRFLPADLTIAFMNGRGMASIFSALLIAGSILFWLLVGLNTGIDFRGGFVIEVKTLEGKANVEALREEDGNISGLPEADRRYYALMQKKAQEEERWVELDSIASSLR